MPKFDAPHASELWTAGACLCGICGNPVDEPPRKGIGRGNGGTVEHVFPRHPKAADERRMKRLRALVADPKGRRKVIAHRKCNSRKSNRPPTGCEIVFLMAVNARLAARIPEITASERTRARRERRRRGKEALALIEAMQAEVDAF